MMGRGMIAAGRRSAGPRRRAVLAAAALVAVGRGGPAGAAGPAPARAPQWRLDVGRSRIAVTLARGGGGDATIDGGFAAFDAAVRLDPARPEAASVTLTIDAGSFGTGDT